MSSTCGSLPGVLREDKAAAGRLARDMFFENSLRAPAAAFIPQRGQTGKRGVPEAMCRQTAFSAVMWTGCMRSGS